MKKVCVVTGTRAEYGLLKPLIEKISCSEEMELQLAVTGMHLSPEFGLTYREIEADGYPITAKIEMLLSSDTASGITKSMGVALIGFADYFDSFEPDIVILLGDRYEILAAATAAMVARIPIAHIHGGELTEGLIDESIRHSITKMSQLHFTTTETYRKRVIQLGEQPASVYNVGSLGVESICSLKLLDKVQLETELGFTFSSKTIMVTYHPVTLENQTAEGQFENLLDVIDKEKEIKVIFTKANSDTDGRIINHMIDKFAAKNNRRCAVFASMGQLKYLSALQFCCAVAGNSSSGIIEVPSFHIPTINIGDRQKGRVCAQTVINCGNSVSDIDKAFQRAFSKDFLQSIEKADNPYEGEKTSERILQAVSGQLEKGIELKKRFYDMEEL